MTLAADTQQLAIANRVELFVLDATSLGGGIHRFCSASKNKTAVQCQGHTFAPYPVEAKGFDLTSGTAFPTPTLSLYDKSRILLNLAITTNDLIGAKIIRYVTLAKYLDGETEADPNEHFPVDIYYIDRKVKQSGVLIEWELASLLDMQGKELPGRVMLKDLCSYRYRLWDADHGVFDYSAATCPYMQLAKYTPAVEGFFTKDGTVTTAPNDVCGLSLSSCVLRFGSGVLPFKGFPGISSVRR